uniref:Putative adenylate cyclase n=1 Tax=Rhipicephalus microplus TaxID=6941 RepID=A0A6M2D1B3_RHIMP
MHAALSLDTDDFEGVHSTSSRTPLLRTRAQSDQTSCFMDMAEQQPNITMANKKAPPNMRRVDWLHFVRTLHLELFLFVYAVSYSMRLVMTQDLLLTKACWQRHAINASACRNLSWNVTIKDDVTRYANLHNLVLFLIQFVPAGLLSIFVSPWSDRYGHKIPLLVATSGGILQDLTTLFSVMYTSVPLYATVLCAIPNGFSGGLVSVCASVYSNGTRTATAELKTVRFACIMTALTLGFQLGLFVGGQVFRAAGGNYTAIYVTSAILLALMFVWIGWTVPFSNQLHRTSRRELIRDLIRLDNLREGGQAVFRQRPGYNRAKLLLLMISIWFILFNSESECLLLQLDYNKG